MGVVIGIHAEPGFSQETHCSPRSPIATIDAMTTGDVFVECLLDWDVDIELGLPGDGVNGIIEAFRTSQEKILFIQVRHEEAAALMARLCQVHGQTRDAWFLLGLGNLVWLPTSSRFAVRPLPPHRADALSSAPQKAYAGLSPPVSA